jgi:hypothetical protein
VAAGGTYAGSWAALRAYDQPDKTNEERDRLRLLTNGLSVSAGAFGVLALGTGIGAVVIRRF